MGTEDFAATLARSRTKALASLTATLLEENEPLLKPTVEGSTVTVQVLGEKKALRFTVEEVDVEQRG